MNSRGTDYNNEEISFIRYFVIIANVFAFYLSRSLIPYKKIKRKIKKEIETKTKQKTKQNKTTKHKTNVDTKKS